MRPSRHGALRPKWPIWPTFDWDDAAGRTAVIPHMVALPSEFRPRIESFVRNGGKLIVTGLSGFYDENQRCLFMNGFPLKSCFGAEVSEFKVAGEYFTLGEELPAHLWRGILVPASGETMMTDGGDVAAVRNRYGRGEVVWVALPDRIGRLPPRYGSVDGFLRAGVPRRHRRGSGFVQHARTGRADAHHAQRGRFDDRDCQQASGKRGHTAAYGAIRRSARDLRRGLG